MRYSVHSFMVFPRSIFRGSETGKLVRIQHSPRYCKSRCSPHKPLGSWEGSKRTIPDKSGDRPESCQAIGGMEEVVTFVEYKIIG